MSSASLRYIAPLAALTGVGLIASDLYISSLPYVVQDLQTTLPHVQGTLAIFMVALAVSQLFWGKFADRLGMQHALLLGLGLQCIAGIGCAMASNIDTLIFWRILQGIGAGAATVVVPVLLRRRFKDKEAIRAIAWVGIVESAVPALAPVLGTLILVWSGWRANFWFTTALTFVFIPFILKLVPNDKATVEQRQAASYKKLLEHTSFWRNTVVYALTFAALITFVASAPHIIHHWLLEPPGTFAVLQLLGVLAFIAAAARTTPAISRFGDDKVMRWGALLQLFGAAGFVIMALAMFKNAATMVVLWMVFCGGLGLRAAPTITRALSVPAHLTSLASGMLMFITLLTTSAGIQMASFLLASGLFPVACLMVLMIGASLWLQQPAPCTTDAKTGSL